MGMPSSSASRQLRHEVTVSSPCADAHRWCCAPGARFFPVESPSTKGQMLWSHIAFRIRDGTKIPSITLEVEIEAWAERRLSAHSRGISMCSFKSARAEYTL